MKKIFFAQNVVDEIIDPLGNGYLYNYYAAGDINMFPTGWRLPTTAEYITLLSYLDPSAARKLMSTNEGNWNTPNSANNDSGWTGVGSGFRAPSGAFDGIKGYATFWTSDSSATTSEYFYLADESTSTGVSINKEAGLSIRAIYEGAGTPSTVTDNDANIYDTVVIGTQRWTVQNWKCTTLDNGDSIPTETDNTNWANATTLKKCAYSNDEGNV